MRDLRARRAADLRVEPVRGRRYHDRVSGRDEGRRDHPDQRLNPVCRNDRPWRHPQPGRDCSTEIAVGLLRVHPRVGELFGDRIENAVERTEEILVPVELPQRIDAGARLDLAQALTRVIRGDTDQRRLDERAPIGQGWIHRTVVWRTTTAGPSTPSAHARSSARVSGVAGRAGTPKAAQTARKSGWVRSTA